MKKRILIISIVTILTSILVMIGWFLDIEILKSILPQWATMKFTTALSFLFSGIILYSVNEYIHKHSSWAQIVLSISSLVILLFMTTLLGSIIFNMPTGIEDLFVQESENAIFTTVPGRPSSGTVVSFILIAITALVAISKIKYTEKYIFSIGLLLQIIGIIALLGYLLELPILYYTFEDISNAMAVHTAILFVLLGFGLFSIDRQREVSL